MPGDTAATARTLSQLLRQQAVRYPDRMAFGFSPDGEKEQARVTYRELDLRARAIAADLRQYGATGERVLVLCPPGLEFVASLFGCVYAGAVAVPVHPPVHKRLMPRLAAIIADAQAGFALSTGATQAKVRPAVDRLVHGRGLRWFVSDDGRPADTGEWVTLDDAGSAVVIQYTSGSTGSPKGVVLTNENLMHNLEALRQAWHGDDRGVGVFWLPPHHDMGLIGGILETLYVGGTSLLMPPTALVERPMRWLETISRRGATISAAPNFAYDMCVDRSTEPERAALDLSTWTTAWCGAEPVRDATLRRFADAFAPAGFRPETFLPAYGLAEATLLVSGGASSAVPVMRHVDSVALRERRIRDVAGDHPSAAPFVGCGRPARGVRIAIVDPDTLQRCPTDRIGEIWVAGPSVARGYWNRPAETADTFGAVLADGDGPYLRTGDMGFLRDGELYVVGRLKDVIIIRGRNYYPDDIEATAAASHPALLRGRSAAFSVPAESESGEQLVVVQEVDRHRIRDLDVAEVIDAVRTAITEQQAIPIHAVVLARPLRIPTTSSGKIERNTCRRRFLDGELNPLAEWRMPKTPTDMGMALTAGAGPADAVRGKERPDAGAIAAWLASRLAAELGTSAAEIDPSRPFAYYGLDSVHAVRVTAALGEWLSRKLSPTLAYEYPTIDLLAQHLADGTSAGEAATATAVDVQPPGHDEPIAIIGLGCRFPGADGPEEFWRLLRDGMHAIKEVPPDRWDVDALYHPDPAVPGATTTRWGGFIEQVDEFDPQFFGISPRESVRMDPQQRLLLEVAWEALEDAGVVPQRLTGSRTGTFVGIATNDYGQLQFGEPESIDAYSGTGNALSIAANRLSYALDLRGPSMAVDTACSSSLVAVHLACRSLRDGECSLALAGGVNLVLSPTITINFSKAGVMAADGQCKAFDARADGYVRGEGAGIVVLKPLARALADKDRVYAVIHGSATNHGGRTNGLMAPSRQAQEGVLIEAYRRAGLSPGTVQYVEAHGSGTFLGDPIEAKALGAVLADGRPADSRCLIGSVKTNIGHLEAAAGVAGLIKVALSLAHREIPPSLNFEQPNPHIPFDSLPLRVARVLTPWPGEGLRAVAGVSSFGFGGTNAHVVLTEAPQARAALVADEQPSGRAALLPLSARSPDALRALAGRYERVLAGDPPVADLCYTVGSRRTHHQHRLAVVGESAAQLADALAAYRRGEPRAGLSTGHCHSAQAPAVVFVFSGQGSQWLGMGQRLQAEMPVFREALAECDRAMRPYLDGSLLAELAADASASRLADIGIVQPAIFAVQVALAALWRSWGVQPHAVVGHSLGEVVAAYVAGALTLAEAAQVICGRSRVLRRVRGQGAMAVVELSSEQARELIDGQEDRLAIAATNSHRSTVLAGDPAALDAVMAVLRDRDVYCQLAKVDVASHSPQMDLLRGELAEVLAGLRPAPPAVPFYSTVTGGLLDGGVLDDAYWMDNLRSPVSFSPVLRHLLATGHETFLEVSPHALLLGAIRQDAQDLGRDCALLPSMRRDDAGRATALTSLGALYTAGQPVAWERLHPQGGRCVAAPTYPWERRRFWLTPAEGTPAASRPNAGTRSGSAPLHSSVHPNTVFWEMEVGTESTPELVDHRVHGAPVLPAAMVLELVSVAASRAFGPAARVLRDITFHRPLTLAEGRTRTVQLVLTGAPPGAISVECYVSEPGRRGIPQWALLVDGTIDAAALAPGTEGELKAPDDIRARCREAMSGTSYYQLLAGHGLQYGPAFQALRDVWRRDGEAIARLASPAEGSIPLAGDQEAGGLDTRILDACFQALAAAFASADPHGTGLGGNAYLPVGLASLRIVGTLRDGAWCHAVLRTGTDLEPDTAEGDVFLLRENGQVVVAASGLRLRQIPSEPVDIDRTQLPNRCYELSWEPASATDVPATASPALPAPDAASWLILSDDSEIADTLCAGLESEGQRCMLVTPGTAYAADTPDRYRVDPTQPAHFDRLLGEAFGAGAPPCRAVVHLWGLRAEPPSGDSIDPLESARRLGPVSVLHLVQALGHTGLPGSPRLWLVTGGAQAVGNEAVPVSIEQAPLWGLGRSIDHEHPELRCVRVDLSDRHTAPERSALLRELWTDGPERDVALRDDRRYVARLVPLDEAAASPAAPEAAIGDPAYQMVYPTPGSLDDLRAVAAIRTPPGPQEVEIRVHAAGLNFMDAMRALGVYPGQGDGPVSPGIECAGTVTAVGAGVEGVSVGDAVVAVAPYCVGAFVTTRACLVAAKPPDLSFEAAAAIPIAYLTAFYALHEQGRLCRGERVLIHSAAGGVGLAAIQVAQWLGARVYATAGTSEKREYLRALGSSYVGDSRSLAFADEMLEATAGTGVDVVLNSLTGEAIDRSLAVLGPYGRFLEIGKRDVYQNGRVRLWQLRRNASYTVIDLAQLALDRPEYVGSMLREVVALIQDGALRPLPVRVLPVAESAAAVRCLAQGRQIGKVVVAVHGQAAPPTAAGAPPTSFRADATYLITGGLGGLGRTVAEWMVERGARHLVLVGRGPAPASVAGSLDALRALGAEVVVARGDVTRGDEVAAILDSLRESMPPLRGVIHAAGTLNDAFLLRLDQRRLQQVMAPKVDGAWHLHRLTADTPLDFFVLFSSAASLLGSPGQGHYAAGNAFLDALAWQRRAQGRPALCVNWGPWADIGLVTRAGQHRHLSHHGVEVIPPPDGIRSLSRLLGRPAVQVAVLRVDWQRWHAALPADQQPTLLAYLRADVPGSGSGDLRPLLEMVRLADRQERRKLLTVYLCEQAAGKLGLASSRLDIEQPLNQLGVDSLIASELRTQIQRDLGTVVPVVQLLEGPSVASLADWLSDRLSADPAPPDAAATELTEAATKESVTAIALLSRIPELSDDAVDELLRHVLSGEGDGDDR